MTRRNDRLLRAALPSAPQPGLLNAIADGFGEALFRILRCRSKLSIALLWTDEAEVQILGADDNVLKNPNLQSPAHETMVVDKHGSHHRRRIRCSRTARTHRRTISSGTAGLGYRIPSRTQPNMTENHSPPGTGRRAPNCYNKRPARPRTVSGTSRPRIWDNRGLRLAASPGRVGRACWKAY